MSTLRFLEAPVPCRSCGLPTVTVTVGGRLPLHVGCDHRRTADLDDQDLLALLALLVTRFAPGIRLNPPPPPLFIDQVGPCVRCRRPTRRYGPHGLALCHDCDERSPSMSKLLGIQDPLFPTGACACEHVGLIAEDGEPCPVCLTGARGDSPHDCPMRVTRHLLGHKGRTRK